MTILDDHIERQFSFFKTKFLSSFRILFFRSTVFHGYFVLQSLVNQYKRNDTTFYSSRVNTLKRHLEKYQKFVREWPEKISNHLYHGTFLPYL